MKVELKTWGALGLATALAGAGIAGCSGEAGENANPAETAQVGEGGEGGEGEGGEGGESGEGGVDIASAASDPVTYTTALAIAEAHVLAARDAYRAGQTEAAAEMFAHPVSEVLADMDPVLTESGVADFKPLFSEASQAAFAGASVKDVDAKVDDIIAALRGAAQKAPDNGTSDAAVAGGVIADQIERAVAMYAEASSSDQYAPYLDGYGFYMAAKAHFELSGDAIRGENESLHTKIGQALALLAKAYPAAERPASLDANQGALSGASSSVMLSAN